MTALSYIYSSYTFCPHRGNVGNPATSAKVCRERLNPFEALVAKGIKIIVSVMWSFVCRVPTATVGTAPPIPLPKLSPTAAWLGLRLLRSCKLLLQRGDLCIQPPCRSRVCLQMGVQVVDVHCALSKLSLDC